MDQASKDSDTMFDNDTLEDALDKVLTLARKHRAAEIDAGACGTRTDYKNMHAAERVFNDARDAFLSRFADCEAHARLLANERCKVAGLAAALKATVARLRNAKEAAANVQLVLGDID